MTALIDRQDAEILGQGRQDRAIGAGVEAVRMDENDVDRPRGVAELERRHRAAPTFKLDQPRPGRIR